MPFTATVTVQHSIEEQNTFGINSTVQAYRNVAVQQNSCEREHSQVHKVSASLSAHELPINPLGVCAASLAMLVFWPDHPVDLRIGAQSADIISAVRFMVLAATVSSLWVTTGSQATYIRTMLTGGSSAEFNITSPSPT